MDKCTHDVGWLTGYADGILCKRCGVKFRDLAALEADRAGAGDSETAGKPKRKRKAGVGGEEAAAV